MIRASVPEGRWTFISLMPIIPLSILCHAFKFVELGQRLDGAEIIDLHSFERGQGWIGRLIEHFQLTGVLLLALLQLLLHLPLPLFLQPALLLLPLAQPQLLLFPQPVP